MKALVDATTTPVTIATPRWPRVAGGSGGGVFGELVMAYRRQLGMTQEELADRTGLSVRTIRELESGRTRSPRPASVLLLADAFGLGGPQLRHFQRRADDSREPTAPGEESRGFTSERRTSAPAQLPAAVAGFTGRGQDMAELDAHLSSRPAAAVMISVVAGTAGVGKTALAVHWAHRVADQFPDGQLYIDLRGYHPAQPMTSSEALVRFLVALGVPGPEIPLDVDARAARYRTEVAGRRLLIVLDNASTVEQVRPLLPGSAACAVIVTSRDSLAGLVVRHGARRLDLEPLPAAEARDLLGTLIGRRARAEPAAITGLVDLCARLPLALRIAAELATSRPDTSVADLVTELAEGQRRLDLLDAGGDPYAAVQTVFSWSLRHLSGLVTRAFRLLGRHPGPDFDPYVVAALADVSLAQGRQILRRLSGAHLVHPAPGGRHALHDLLREYAISLPSPDAEDGPAALGRLFDYYLGTAAAAMDLLHPGEIHRRPRLPPPTTPTPALADPEAARRWLDAELPCLVTMSTQAALDRLPDHAVAMSTTLYRFLDGGHHSEALTIHGHARDAAALAGDTVGEAQARLSLGTVLWQLGRHRLADENLRRSLDLFHRADDDLGQARALGTLGMVEAWQGHYGPAADLHQRSLALFRQAGGDQTGEAHVLNNLGLVEGWLGRHDVALAHHERALNLFRRAGDSTGTAMALTNLGLAEERSQRYESALDHMRQALALYRQVGDRAGAASVLDGLGTLHTRLGEPERAAEMHEEALTFFRSTGERDAEAWALNGLGEAHHAGGDAAAALTYHDAALEIATDTGIQDQRGRAELGLGRAHDALGDRALARRHYELALAVYTELGSAEAGTVEALLSTMDDEPADRA
jgi:tetratricopeptide (TPR) repeat protein/transcriptional regulator with XRE-family HTH domain